jgi:transposase-like protein
VSEISILRLVEQIPDEAAAYEWLEKRRWNGRPECPHCGNRERCYYLNPANGVSRETRTGAATQRRLWKCGSCRKQFSVLTGTVMHGTKTPVRTWAFVLVEMAANKNGVSAREVARKYDLCPRSAWFLVHRIREAMKADPVASPFVGTVVADETFFGHTPKRRRLYEPPMDAEPVRVKPGERQLLQNSHLNKTIVLTLVERDTGRAHSRVIPDVTGATLRKAIAERVILASTTLHTDEGAGYRVLRAELAGHKTVNHSQDEYARREGGEVVTSNQAENFFSQLKRSLDGTHHHVSRYHLHRYLAEFDLRYSTRKMTDSERTAVIVGRCGGRRLTYKGLSS